MRKKLRVLFCRAFSHDWAAVRWYSGRPVRWLCCRCHQVKYLREG